MRSTFTRLSVKVHGTVVVAAVLGSLGFVLGAQTPSSTTDTQRQAMQKLAFLAGHWSGPITVVRGPGEPLHAVQSEEVQFKLNGLLMLVEGKSTSADGKVQFSALATISYDDATKAYRFRAYNDGHYIDTELTVAGNGFSWSFAAGPAHVVNTMHLTDKNEWQESTEVDLGNNLPRKAVDMTLKRQAE
jgi:hypothetical protein